MPHAILREVECKTKVEARPNKLMALSQIVDKKNSASSLHSSFNKREDLNESTKEKLYISNTQNDLRDNGR